MPQWYNASYEYEIKVNDTRLFEKKKYIQEQTQNNADMWRWGPVLPLRLYVAKLVQHFEKLAQQILKEWVKKMLFLDNLANFQPKLMILAQEPLQFCQIW